MIACAFAWALVAAQDQASVDGFLQLCAKPGRETAEAARVCLRRGLESALKDSSAWYALYVVACQSGEKGGHVPSDVLKRLADHVSKLAAEKPDGARHADFAAALAEDKSETVKFVAMGHLDDALAAKAPAGKVEAAAKKLGLVLHEGVWATPVYLVLSRMKALAPADAVGVGTNSDFAKEDALGVRYFRAVCLLRALEKNMALHKDLVSVLNQVKADPNAREHCEALKKQIETFMDCSICKKNRETTCQGCSGKGTRELVCQWCNGKGEKIEIRNVNGQAQAHACPTCLNKPERMRRTEKCEYCVGRGKVACERCKYMIPRYEDMVREADCSRCEKSGGCFREVKAPCPFCLGLGVHLKPSGAPDKRAGPIE
jgi:hypothetical protein